MFWSQDQDHLSPADEEYMFFYFLEKVLPPLPSSSSWSTLEEESATLLKAHAWKGGNVLGTYSDLT